MKTKSYFCFLVYYATGEPAQEATSYICAANKAQAEFMFLNHLYADHSDKQGCIDYFGRDVVVYQTTKNNISKIKERLECYFTPHHVDHTMKALSFSALQEFHYSYRTNFS